MNATTSFPFRYGALRPLLSILGMGPAFSSVTVEGQDLRVKMGWAFRATIPVQSITGVQPRQGLVGGIGVHGWQGRWLVNGAATGLVMITVDPRARAWAVGIRVKLRQLTLSLEDPDALSVALGR